MKTEEDIRAAAFAEAAELIQKRWRFRSMQDADDAPLLVKAILDLGKPKPDPRSRRITVTFTVADKWTYVFDRDILINQDARQQVPLTEGEADMGDILERIIALTRPERDLLLYALEQERAKLAVASFASTSWQDAGVAAKRLGHLNLFLGERT